MLSSRACLWRSIRAVEPSTASSHPHCRNAVSTLVTQQRFLRTPSANIRKVEARPKSLTKIEKLQQTGREPWKRSGQALDQQRQERSELKRAPRDHGEVAAGDMWLGTRGRVPYAEWNARRRELRYLRDPLKITGFVKQELHKGRVNEMLQLVRMASHSMQCVVSWNHIIDYYMAKEQVAEALKVYNEVRISVIHAGSEC
jgi:pentatricopeptide repeat protein